MIVAAVVVVVLMTVVGIAKQVFVADKLTAVVIAVLALFVAVDIVMVDKLVLDIEFFRYSLLVHIELFDIQAVLVVAFGFDLTLADFDKLEVAYFLVDFGLSKE